MQTLTDKERQVRGLDALGLALAPFVDGRMQRAAGERSWLELYQAAESARRGRPYRIDPHDPRALLRILRYERGVFSEIDATQRAWIDEIIQAANRAAHATRIDAAAADRALDTMRLLAESLDLADDVVTTLVELRATGRTSALVTVEAEEHELHSDESGATPAQAATRVPDLDPAPGLQTLSARIGDLDVVVEYWEGLTLALARSGVSPVLSVVAVNNGVQTVRDVAVEISIAPLPGADPVSVAAPVRVALGDIPSGERRDAPSAAIAMRVTDAPFLISDEAIATAIRMEVTVGGRRWSDGNDIRILVADEWRRDHGPELLAAFVRPNDSAIGHLLEDASALLQARTGSPSLQGYQAGPERAHAIAEAIYDAMAEREIVYVEEPASFESTGQRIRSHADVLEQHRGTCIDLACTYAAALEQAGIRPAIFVLRTHALVGYFTEDEQLPSPVLHEQGVIRTLVDSDVFEVVETTALCSSEHRTDFDHARGIARTSLRSAPEEIAHVVDISAAHRRVKPLPSMRWEGGVRILEIVKETRPAPERRIAAPPTPRRPAEAPARIENWRRSLLDMTYVNPLLKLKPAGSIGLFVPPAAIATLEDEIAGGTPFTLRPGDAINPLALSQGARTAGDLQPDVLTSILLEERSIHVAATSTEYARRLKNLQRRARTAAEETGADILYLTLGRLRWREGTREGNAPLFLVPVRLLRGRGSTPFQIALDDNRTREPNYCLHEKLRVTWGLDLPQLVEPQEDASGIDIAGAIAGIRTALLRSEKTEFYVEEAAHLSLLQFSTLEMWRDLTQNWTRFIERPAVRHLVETPGQPFDDGIEAPDPEPAAEATTYLPIPADGSQIQAVRWAAAGKSFILEGPPGTGKSQTITNLIAHCLATGKRVVFVAEKQAALDVVKRRLDDIGLGRFSLDVHGRTQSVGAVREQLREALEARADADPSWSALQSSYRAVVESLARYPNQVHEPGPTGLSAWEARQIVLELDETAPAEPFPVPRAVAMGSTDLESVYRAASELSNALLDLGVGPDRSPWRLAGSLDPDKLDRRAVAQALHRLVDAEARVADHQMQIVLDHTLEQRQVEALVTWLETRERGLARACSEAAALVTPSWRAAAHELLSAVQGFRARALPVLASFPDYVLRLDLDSLYTAAVEADGKLFKRRRRMAILKDLGFADGLPPFPVAGLSEQLAMLRAIRHEADALAQRATALPGLSLPQSWNAFADAHVQLLADVVRGAEVSADLAEAYAGGPSASSVIHDLTHRLVTAPHSSAPGPADIREVTAAWSAWLAALGTRASDLTAWLAGRSRSEAFTATVQEWQADAAGDAFLRLHRWLRMRRAADQLEHLGFTGVGAQARAGEISPHGLEQRVRAGVARTIIDERLESTGLVAFDEATRSHEIDRFLRTGADFRRRMVAELPARIVAARTFDPTKPRGKVAELQSQLGRRRGGMTIRQLFQHYGSIIAEITPCILMSPASVARFLPPDSVDFDVVVFDEASQIRVPEAIGAMGRGKAVVIVGDSKQMPPTSMFSSSPTAIDDDIDAPADEGLPVPVDLESILSEAGESHLPRLLLSWHYRSRDESLIAFSNQHYYEGRLSSFPTPPVAGEPALELRRVDGVWEGGARGARVNRAEAHAVVSEIRTRIAERPTESIGVVTFNSQQRDLILDLLEQAAEHDAALAEAMARDDEPLFVKNLENVQGDERDVILFTLAFARDPATGRVPLTWGPLVREGGEKRLNVAITRAKSRVVVFASFDPHELDLAGSRSLGLAHLKDYLAMAKAGVENTPLRRPAARDRHLEDVAAALGAAGLLVRPRVGLSDFTVDLAVRASEDAPWVAVLLDGPSWAERSSVGDRDGLPSTVLTGSMGWRAVERVWLPAWLRDPSETVARIAATARRLAEEPELSVPPSAPTAAEPAPQESSPLRSATPASEAAQAHRGVEAQSGAAGDRIPGAAIFSAASDVAVYPRELLDGTTRDVRERIRSTARDVVEEEGPILLDRLISLVGARFGFGRIRESRREQLLSHLDRSSIRRSANGDHVAWPDGVEAQSYTGFRVPPPGHQRAIDQVPYEELRNALVYVVCSSHGIGRIDALRETARLFGVTRLGSIVRGRLDAVIKAAAKERLISVDGDDLVPSSTGNHVP